MYEIQNESVARGAHTWDSHLHILGYSVARSLQFYTVRGG